MTRHMIVLVATMMGWLVASVPSHACCNAFPPGLPTSSVMQFHGARGTLASPFLIPSDTLRITRRACDEPSGASFPADAPDDVRTVVIVRPRGKVHAIILKRGTTNGPCGTDPFTANCLDEIRKVPGGGDADCLSVMNYTVQPGVVEIELPDLLSTRPRATSSRTAVAVLRKDDAATVCGQLAKTDNHCSDAIGAQSELLACIDQIGVPTDPTSPCTGMVAHPVFKEATLLPVPNDIKQVCHKTVGGAFCDPLPADELRYGVDPPSNVLIPVSWKRSLDLCPGQSLRVQGEVRSPCSLQIPANGPQLHRNKWLESYTFDGRLNVPPFEKDHPSHPALNRFEGTTDEPLSVLRLGAFYGVCSSSSGELCSRPDRCSTLGDICDAICTNNNARCGPTQPCSGGGKCGKLHDLGPEFSNGRWRLGRNPGPPTSCPASGNPHGFCEDDPTTLCNGQGQCPGGDCASYLLTVGGCESPAAATSTPSTQAAPGMEIPVAFQPLLQALGIPRDAVDLVAASSDNALALIVPRMLLGERAAQCRSLGLDNVLVAASVRDCGKDGCPFTCPPLGAGALVPRLVVYGTSVRFLQLPEVAAAAPGMLAAVGRFFQRIFGGTEEQAAPPGERERAFLRILDTASSAVTTVGEIVISDPRFDPFAIGSNGATKLLAEKGRCVSSDGRTLGIPSFCDPGGTGECPAWATCKAADVVMVMDLSLAP